MRTVACALGAFLAAAAAARSGEEAAWETVSIPGICTFEIPPTMELQKGAYKKVVGEGNKTVLKIEKSPDKVVAQQEGLNESKPEALDKYCRVVVETDRGEKNPQRKFGRKIRLSEDDMRVANDMFKQEVEREMILFSFKGVKRALLSWEPLKIVSIPGGSAFRLSYRQKTGDDAPVVVVEYRVWNNDCEHKVSLLYREKEKDLWAEDLGKVIDKFKFVAR